MDEYNSIIKEFLKRPNAEALQWLRSARGDQRILGEHQSADPGIALVEDLYALGAQKVLAVDLQELEDGTSWTRYLLVELPEEHRRRDPLFAFEREHAEAHGFDGTPDEGQLYLFLDVKGID
jgi:hypothetical protein